MSAWDVINMINDVAGIDPLHITIESSPSDVKKAYRRAAIKTHPDKANQLDELEVYKFQEYFKLLKDKYDDYLARFAPAGYLRRRKRHRST
jgi:curved DNA-binding protein CbpA